MLVDTLALRICDPTSWLDILPHSLTSNHSSTYLQQTLTITTLLNHATPLPPRPPRPLHPPTLPSLPTTPVPSLSLHPHIILYDLHPQHTPLLQENHPPPPPPSLRHHLHPLRHTSLSRRAPHHPNRPLRHRTRRVRNRSGRDREENSLCGG